MKWSAGERRLGRLLLVGLLIRRHLSFRHLSFGAAYCLSPRVLRRDYSIENSAAFGRAVVGVFAWNVDLAVGGYFSRLARLENRDGAGFGVEGHGDHARALKAILVGGGGFAGGPGLGHFLAAVRPADIADQLVVLDGKQIMAAPDLPGEAGAEAAEFVGGEGLHIAQQRHRMAERLAPVAEAPDGKLAMASTVAGGCGFGAGLGRSLFLRLALSLSLKVRLLAHPGCSRRANQGALVKGTE
jgi:hypothetical protein